MRIRIIACEVFARELMLAGAVSPHVVDLTLMPFGLHDTPEELRKELQKEVSATRSERYDFIALCYGLCSRGTVGIRTEHIPLVIPRAHDCITLLLGSRKRYNEEFSQHPGTYYYSPGWIERKIGEVQQEVIDNAYAKLTQERFEEYARKYGEDNARFLIQQESLWMKHYTRAAFINTGLGNIDAYRRFTRDLAAERGWEYAEIEGDTSLLNRLACADWNEDEFLIVQPRSSILEAYDGTIVRQGRQQ